MSGIIIRKAEKEDMKSVCELIKELARFENMENQCKISSTTLEKDGFDSPSPFFSCLVAELSDQILGFALYYNSYSTWLGKAVFLEDLYVRESHRKAGIGRKLFVAVAAIAQKSPAKRLDFHVLSWNPATEFYRSLGARDLTVSEKWHMYRLDEKCLEKLLS